MPTPPHPRPCKHRHPGRSGNLYGLRRGRSAARRSARLRITARRTPGCFSTPYPRSAVFRTSRIHFPRRSAAGNFLVQTQKLRRKSFLMLDGIACRLDPDFNAWLETLAACLRNVRNRSWGPNLSILYRVARPARFLSFRGGHANALGSVRACPGTNFVQMQKRC
jgi:hypothetical protein